VLDGETVLATANRGWIYERSYDLKLQVVGHILTGFINGEKVIESADPNQGRHCLD
jgi:hypothetical protein